MMLPFWEFSLSTFFLSGDATNVRHISFRFVWIMHANASDLFIEMSRNFADAAAFKFWANFKQTNKKTKLHQVLTVEMET